MQALPEMLEAAAREYQIVEMSSIQATDLERFFAAQPEESFKFFKPHGFDAKSLRKLQKNKAFLAFIVNNTPFIQSTKSQMNGRWSLRKCANLYISIFPS